MHINVMGGDKNCSEYAVVVVWELMILESSVGGGGVGDVNCKFPHEMQSFWYELPRS